MQDSYHKYEQMERKQLMQFSKAQSPNGQWLAFSFRTPKPQLFYAFNRLFALKPKNPV